MNKSMYLGPFQKKKLFQNKSLFLFCAPESVNVQSWSKITSLKHMIKCAREAHLCTTCVNVAAVKNGGHLCYIDVHMTWFLSNGFGNMA
jgi:hypothetical protein